MSEKNYGGPYGLHVDEQVSEVTLTQELLGCPFCDGEARLIEADDAHGRFFCVACEQCDACTKEAYFVSKDDPRPIVIQAWNIRVSPPAPGREVVEALRNLLSFDLMAKWSPDRAGQFPAAVERARAALSALAGEERADG